RHGRTRRNNTMTDKSNVTYHFGEPTPEGIPVEVWGRYQVLRHYATAVVNYVTKETEGGGRRFFAFGPTWLVPNPFRYHMTLSRLNELAMSVQRELLAVRPTMKIPEPPEAPAILFDLELQP